MSNNEKQGLLLTGGTIVTEEEIINEGYLFIEDTRIIAVGNKEEMPRKAFDYPVIKLAEENIILPGFIDLHIHGAAGSDVMDGTHEALENISETLLKEGTTSFLATTMTKDKEDILKAVKNVATFMKKEYFGAECLGIHLEGPFISPNQAGAQALDHIVKPNIKDFELFQQEAEGSIRIVTMAPEEDAEYQFIKYLKSQGVIPSIGHSQATFKETKESVSSGVTHATHLYNAMRSMHHREAAVVGAILLDENITAEIILDGIHLSEEMAQLAYKLKGPKKLQLITDSIRAKGLKEGEYDLGGQRVTVKGKEVRLANGMLAGSVLKMNEAVKMVYKIVGGNLPELVALSSKNAAEELGISDRKGSITSGKDADIVILDSGFNVKLTICRGKLSYID